MILRTLSGSEISHIFLRFNTTIQKCIRTGNLQLATKANVI